MNWNIEFFKKDGMFCAYIDDGQGGSGITIKKPTQKELGDDISLYVQDMNDELTGFVG